MTRRLRIVGPPPAEPARIYDQHLADIRARDWPAVHLAGDRNPPLTFITRPWRWSNPRPRKSSIRKPS